MSPTLRRRALRKAADEAAVAAKNKRTKPITQAAALSSNTRQQRPSRKCSPSITNYKEEKYMDDRIDNSNNNDEDENSSESSVIVIEDSSESFNSEQEPRNSRRSSRQVQQQQQSSMQRQKRRTSSRSTKFQSSMNDGDLHLKRDYSRTTRTSLLSAAEITTTTADEEETRSDSEEDEQKDSEEESLPRNRNDPSKRNKKTGSTSTNLLQKKNSSVAAAKTKKMVRGERKSLKTKDNERKIIVLEVNTEEETEPPPKEYLQNKGSESSKGKKRTLESDDNEYVESSQSSSQEEASDEDDENSDEDGEPPFDIQRILASRRKSIREWDTICETWNTCEITLGSRWIQEKNKQDTNRKSTKRTNNQKKKNQKKDHIDNTKEKKEERFLIKWKDKSYLHCSWETKKDLLEQIPTANRFLNSFSEKCYPDNCIFDIDERGDGDYFDPTILTIDRILKVDFPETCPIQQPPKQQPQKEKKEKGVVPQNEADDDEIKASDLGIICDTKSPLFEKGLGRQFLIKWNNLPYSESTLEYERDLILHDIPYKNQLKAFNKRKKKPTLAERKTLSGKVRAETKKWYKAFADFAKQTDEQKEQEAKTYEVYLQKQIFKNGGQLRDYQAEGVVWMMANFINERSLILADEMGLGKTIQTAIFIQLLVSKLQRKGPFLVVAPLSTLTHWKREFSEWTDLNTIMYHGSAADRKMIRELDMVYECDRPKSVKHNELYLSKCLRECNRKKDMHPWMVQVVLTTPEILCKDSDFAELKGIDWDVLVVDEAHRLKNHTSKLAVNLREKRFQYSHALLLTGTPIQNDVEEFWSLLSVIDPIQFSNLEKFMEHYGTISNKETLDELHKEIRPYILRRLKEDVEKSVPPKEETVIEVELTIEQKQYYRALYEKNLKFLHKSKRKDNPSLNNLAMQLRKCCNHLFLLSGVEDDFKKKEHNVDTSEGDLLVKGSGKLVLLDKLLPHLKKNGHRILLFSQFKIMLDVIEDYLVERNFRFERIDGSITGQRRQQAIDRFQVGREGDATTPFIMLLSTRAGGVGINLTAADTCIIFDSDWNPQNDLQAMARCHRIGQTKNVKIYRLLARKTYEMEMFHKSSLKMGLDQVVLKGFENGCQTQEEVELLLKHGAYGMFASEKAGTSEAESKEFLEESIDTILERRTRIVVHENTGSENHTASTFSKACFAVDDKKMQASDNNHNKNADVDVEDPDFWTKVVGESNNENEDEEILMLPAKRQKTVTNYKEFLHSDPEDSESSFDEQDGDDEDDDEDKMDEEVQDNEECLEKKNDYSNNFITDNMVYPTTATNDSSALECLAKKVFAYGVAHAAVATTISNSGECIETKNDYSDKFRRDNMAYTATSTNDARSGFPVAGNKWEEVYLS